ncbi:AAA family ATPase [Lacticaseibacillus kribbianus]|uniref:AAA family ATPase n=1 Tax=Lacticaseibacillus kribbianus TaxID=2926292 RepID=UPI001CD3001E|nr:SMC family ATPase [Lacticaseibacillus kribbianus]
MQLEQLHIQNFGPYRDERVDFTHFAETPVFLISGKTGSGKTTIFDALVFALYGTTAGDDRSGAEMRAAFATPEAATRVTLAFSHGGRRYEIWRQPDQVLAKKRGTGTTKSPGSMCLTEYDGATERNQWTKQRDIKPRIEAMLHLDANQFRQMVLLPQGKFRQFLDASSNDKEALLRNLFGTGLYERWEEALRQSAKDANAAVGKESERLATLASRFAYPDAAPAAEASLPDKMAAMKAGVAVLDKAAQAADAALAAATHKSQKAASALEAGSRLAEAFANRASAQAALAALEQEAPARAAAATRLALLQWAQTLAPQQRQLDKQAAAVVAHQATLDGLHGELPDVQAALAKAEEAQAALTARAAADAADVAKAQTLAQLEPQLAQAADAQAKAATAGKRAADAKAAVEKAEAAQRSAAAAVVATQEAQAQVTDHAAALHEAETALAGLLPQYRQWQTGAKHLAALAKQQTAAQTALTAAQAAADAAAQAYQDLHDRQLSQQIAALAAKLSPDAPCPVCGSLEHPHPATIAVAPVADAAVAAADSERLATAQAAATAQSAAAELARQLAEAQTAQAALTQALQGAADRPVPDVIAAAQDAVATTRKAVTAEEKQRAALGEQLTAAQQAADTAVTTLATRQATAQTAATAAAQAAGVASGMAAKLPADAPTLEALKAQSAQLTAKHEAYQKAVRDATAAREHAQAAATTLAATIAAQTQQVADQTTALRRDQAAFAAVLTAKLGDGAPATFAALAAAAGDIAGLQAQLDDAKQRQAAQTALLKQAEGAIGTKEAPDLAALTLARDASAQAQAAAQTVQAQAAQVLAQNRELEAEIAAGYAKNREAIDSATVLASLAAVVNGNNPQRLSLERYVLRAYLDRVLKVGSTRLANLTAGRYQFALHTDPGSYQSDSGLEIDIYDDQIGQLRSVHTLSGGESFVAALSLALALGEVISQVAGGVTIDALFIDEGFGSLDSASLTTAMQALESLEGQSRMIGIISHVEALQVSIPDQLQVVPTGSGESHIRERHAE